MNQSPSCIRLPAVTCNPLQQSPEPPRYYEFGTDKHHGTAKFRCPHYAENRQKRRKIPDVALDRLRRRRSRQTAQVQPGRNHEARAARRAHLPPSLRGSVVDRRAVGGLFLQRLLKQVEPTPKAKYVAFQSYYDPSRCPGPLRGLELSLRGRLRLDEAMHPLTLLCVGMYGETLPPQDGAPVRLVVPWKYGFKSAKSIVKIKFVKSSRPPPGTAMPQRVRLLLQRESQGGPSALEPGQGTPPGRASSSAGPP
jgi:hypothetical protein